MSVRSPVSRPILEPEADSGPQLRPGFLEGARFPDPPVPAVRHSYGYVPVEVDESDCGMGCDRLCKELKKLNVHVRERSRPFVTDFASHRHVQSRDPLTVANEMLCLPTYGDFGTDSTDCICRAVIELGAGAEGHRL